MSVIGFDFGNLNCYIGVARSGGIEVITNDHSLHATPACVSFGNKSRSMGVAARQAVNSNFKNTIINFKHLIGRKFSDPIVQKIIPFIPCGAVQLSEDNIGFKVTYLDEPRVFTPEQILAALLTKLRPVIESQLKDLKKVTDCVIAVPSSFTDIQRRATQAAVEYAGLNPLRIMNESTAIALAYGIYKQDLPEDAEGVKPRNVVFLDVGHASTQASLSSFNKGKLKMLGNTYDMDVGGMWFDALIAEHFRSEFVSKYGFNAKDAPRAWLSLLDESEKVKKQMSANHTPIPINIECFMQGKMQRAEFEKLAAPLFEKVRLLLTNLLAETGLSASDVDEIEIVGGSSRIPMIRKIVQDVFGKDPKTTMNQDEAVARGAAIQCAILSPAFRVREFSIKDTQPYQVKISWQGGAPEGGESDVFQRGDEFPFSKTITLYRNDTFEMNARYALPNTVHNNITNIGHWKITGVTPTSNGDASKIKVKVGINPNGVFTVCSASSVETQTVEDSNNGAEDTSMENAGAPANDKPAEPKTKIVSKELVIEESVPNFDVEKFAKIETEMQQNDLHEKQKADAKNSVEEYSAFDIFCRSILRVRKAYDDYVAGDALYAHLDSKDMEKIINAIEDNKRWLDEARRKQEMRPKTEPPVMFVNEIQSQHTAFESIVKAILSKKPPAAAPPKASEPAQAPETESGDSASQPQAEMEVD